MNKRWTSISLFLALIIVLSACNVSEETVLEHASESFEEKLVQEKKTITYEDENIRLYVPSFTEVEVLDEYNMVFERDNHIFLLFNNEDFEVETKEDLLNELMVEDPFIIEMGEHEGKTGYLVVTESNEDEYTTIVGYDDFKITTITTLKDLNDVAEMMFNIVQSAEKK